MSPPPASPLCGHACVQGGSVRKHSLSELQRSFSCLDLGPCCLKRSQQSSAPAGELRGRHVDKGSTAVI